MAETKIAKNSLAAKQSGTVAEKKEKTIYDVIESGKAQFAAALPKHMSGDKFIRVAITCIRQNPKLAACSQPSLLGAFMTAAQLGLEPGVLGQCYLIPYGNECNFQLGYKGMIELLRRTGQLSDIYAYPVYSNDEFSIEYGLERTLKHVPAFSNPDGRGEVTGFYSVAILKDGTRAFEYMTKNEVKEHEEKYRKGKFKNKVWDDNFVEMALKTVTKKMLKWLPISVEMIENLRKDNATFKMNEETKEITGSYNDDLFGEAEIIDESTGEIIKKDVKDNDVVDLNKDDVAETLFNK